MFRGSFLFRLVLVLDVLALYGVPGAAGQSRPSLTVTAVTADDHRPLPGVEVTVLGTDVHGVTGSDGVVRLEGVRPGQRTVEAQYVGYLTTRTTVSVAASGGELQFEMVPSPVQLAEVQVQGKRDSPLDHNGFFTRKQSGQGTFITRDDIERERPRLLTDLLRHIPGISLSDADRGMEFSQPRASMRGNIGRACQPQVFVDGAQTAGVFILDNILPDQVEGIEVYHGSATVPAEYNRGMAECGVVVIWTRTK